MKTLTRRRRGPRFIADPSPALLRNEQARLSRWLETHPDASNRLDVQQALEDVQRQLGCITTTGTTETPSR